MATVKTSVKLLISVRGLNSSRNSAIVLSSILVPSVLDILTLYSSCWTQSWARIRQTGLRLKTKNMLDRIFDNFFNFE